ncbi:glutathione S-transferase [Noviherbaspirillum humi]|uniref:glutathione transferase n=1 Tax=Noviherbaspirillum humi TaxID=1688639 RepID=A0A239IA98_9BURK|nr:glutathione S-transferase family protein [Noviherbaspirillum humi]SNS90238.1 glutathione S-transferase [Noviherbaspirillum humi]
MTTQPVLVSHALCPYVQRAAIVLKEKGVPFIRRDIDLADKPDWFLDVSPLGKTPVLLVEDTPIFESAVICDYLDEVFAPRLHPEDPLQRARHRAWVEFGSAMLNAIAGFYSAPDEDGLQRAAAALRRRFVQLEAALDSAPYFAGGCFSIVDAAFGPVFRYFDVFDRIGNFGFLDGLSRVQAWRAALAARDSVKAAVSRDYEDLLAAFLMQRGSALSARMRASSATLREAMH